MGYSLFSTFFLLFFRLRHFFFSGWDIQQDIQSNPAPFGTTRDMYERVFATRSFWVSRFFSIVFLYRLRHSTLIQSNPAPFATTRGMYERVFAYRSFWVSRFFSICMKILVHPRTGSNRWYFCGLNENLCGVVGIFVDWNKILFGI